MNLKLQNTTYNLFLYTSPLILLWLIVGSFFSITQQWFYILALGISIFGYIKPKETIYLLLFLLPVFGSRPSMEQTHYLIVLLSFGTIGIYLNLFTHQYRHKIFKAKLRTNSIVLFFITLWFVVSFLSLIGLPAIGMIKKTLEESYFYIFTDILTVGETTLYSSVQSVFYSINAVLIALYIYGTTKYHQKIQTIKNIFLAILAGMFFSVLIGHLEFFRFIDLESYRELDGTSKYGDRLSSFFPHSGWFAQYLAILLPLLTIFLLFKAKLNTKIVLMIIAIIIGEVTLILSMQRGAWLTYPPTLLLFWVSIYYVIAKSKQSDITLPSFFKQNWMKVFITIPLTIVISIFIVIGIKDYRNTNKINIEKTSEKLTNRIQQISHTNDRLIFWPVAYNIWLKSPIYGGGGDSFGWQYKIYYDEKENPFFIIKGPLNQGAFGTAHNMYLQNFVGRGIFGLIFLLAFIGILTYKLIYKEIKAKSSLDESIITISIIGSLLATIIYANVQEIFYSQSVQVIFWIIVFSGILLLDSHKNLYTRRVELNLWMKRSIIILVTLIPLHIITIHPIKLTLLEKLF